MWTLDHIALASTDLMADSAALADRLGVPLGPVGYHDRMGTHNRLLSLGPACYLEVIAIDPQAPAPDRPRWFDLDNFDGPMRLTNWIVASDDLATDVSRRPEIGAPLSFQRGVYRWQMAVPADGKLPFDRVHPAVIEWAGSAHPAPVLPDHDVRLAGLTVTHPQATTLAAACDALRDDRVRFVEGPAGLSATLVGPNGSVTL